jgi:tetratricopeptide (TPR) repeat protein
MSIIVTAHNCANVIGRGLQSVDDAIACLRQKAGNTIANAVEVVVVDDGSTDRTRQVVGVYLAGRPGWRMVRRENASSPSCARNYGAAHATGSTLLFLDGDDLFLPEHLLACSRALADPAVGFVKTGVRLAHPVHADWRPRIHHSLVINLAVRRRCHEAVGGFPDFHLFTREGDRYEHVSDLFFKLEDMFYNELICRLFRGVNVSAETVEYCRHPGNSYDRQYAKFGRPFAEAEPVSGDEGFRLRLCETIIRDRVEQLQRERAGMTDNAHADALQSARKQYRDGNFAGAEAVCRRLQASGAGNAEVCHLLGASCQAQGKLAEADAAYREAGRLRPDHAGSWFALGNLAAAKGRRAEAVDCYRRSVHARPEDAEARTHLGVALAEQGELQEAVAHLRTACRHAPGFAKAHHNLGVALAQSGQPEPAAASLREAIRLNPDYAEAHFNLGNTLVEMNQRAEAVPIFRRALELKPDYVDVLNNLGLALCELGSPAQLAESAQLLQQAVRLKPDHHEALNNLGLTLAEQGRFAEAIAVYDQALRLNPRYVEAHSNLGNAYKEQGLLDEALACYQYALWLQPNAASTHWNRSLAWLQQGGYEPGWAEYEWRWRRKRTKVRPFTQPRWDGSPLGGRTILLYMEQGLGDMIHFIRYAPLVQQRGGKVVVECPDFLMPLFSSVAGIDQLVAEKSPLPPFDVQAPLMSLPHLLGTTLATVPAQVPYLSVPTALIERWRERLSQYSTYKIGIAWQGNPHFKWDRHRSIPLAHFALLAALPGVQLFCLQKNDGLDQLRAAGNRVPVTVLTETLDAETGAFVETGAVMKNLDLVITSDTSIAHLAGALAVPVWVALSAIADWRWLLKRSDTPWYPTMRLFRQEKLGDWPEVFARMANEIQKSLLGKLIRGHLQVEVSAGELLDKIGILEIKRERIKDTSKLANVCPELEALLETSARLLVPTEELRGLAQELRAVNAAIWDVEDEIRGCEQRQEFGGRFIELARSVYRFNDERARLKRTINQLCGSSLVEEKSYPPYTQNKACASRE